MSGPFLRSKRAGYKKKIPSDRRAIEPGGHFVVSMPVSQGRDIEIDFFFFFFQRPAVPVLHAISFQASAASAGIADSRA